MTDQIRDGFYALSNRANCRAVDAAANAVYTFSKPANTNRVYIVAASPVWITIDGTAPAVSAGTSTTAQRTPLATSGVWLGGATEVKIISAVAQKITLEFRGDT